MRACDVQEPVDVGKLVSLFPSSAARLAAQLIVAIKFARAVILDAETLSSIGFRRVGGPSVRDLSNT